jgi:hypothetical protein
MNFHSGILCARIFEVFYQIGKNPIFRIFCSFPVNLTISPHIVGHFQNSPHIVGHFPGFTREVARKEQNSPHITQRGAWVWYGGYGYVVLYYYLKATANLLEIEVDSQASQKKSTMLISEGNTMKSIYAGLATSLVSKQY